MLDHSFARLVYDLPRINLTYRLVVHLIFLQGTWDIIFYQDI